MKWWQKLKTLVLNQLKQGTTPQQMAWTIGWGVTLSVFPVIGLTTLLCLLVGAWRRYNQPIMQAANYVAAPLQILMLPIFMKTGESIFDLPAFPFNPATFVNEFTAGPLKFIAQGGQSALAGVVVWILLAAPLAYVIQKIVYTVLSRTLQKKSSDERGLL